jgi:hypothetical protein
MHWDLYVGREAKLSLLRGIIGVMQRKCWAARKSLMKDSLNTPLVDTHGGAAKRWKTSWLRKGQSKSWSPAVLDRQGDAGFEPFESRRVGLRKPTEDPLA